MRSKLLTARSTTSRTRRMSGAAAAAVLLTIGATITATASPAATTVAHDDFNGDGYHDLVVSASGATVSAQKGAGYVAVLYGSASGISTSRRATFSLSTAGVPGIAQANDRFGKTTASGDLDGDGYADLVVGIPGKDIGTAADAGAAVVLWGSATGLHSSGALWLRDSTPVAGARFGEGLAAGRFKGSRTELAVLLHSKELRTYGFDASAGVRHAYETARFASSAFSGFFTPVGLTSDDYNNDGADDLVVLGIDNDNVDDNKWGSAVYMPGSPDGLTVRGQISGGTTGASGDINKDGYPDLVMGSPANRDWQGAVLDPGSITVLFGRPDGLSSPPDFQYWYQYSPALSGKIKVGDYFGGAVTVGDIDGDGYADAAISAPRKDIGTVTDAGTVWVMRGSATGLTTNGMRTISQSTPSVPGTNEKGDQFGGALRLIDTNRNGKAELIASAPGEDTNDGAAWVFSGTSSGLAATGSWSFNGATLRAPYLDARFGETLAP
ncbi:FG-GAP repeat protein [Streptomyces sp. NPDC001982]|uniref:FG-GAP repeat protein n=1 Tax=Streptomyces sp. NPDC001982 TaxID=3154405 RepID=UPI003327F1C1